MILISKCNVAAPFGFDLTDDVHFGLTAPPPIAGPV